MGNMRFVSFRELRTATAKINDMLTDEGKIVVTSNGKPKALMIQVSENDFEDTLAALNQVKLTRAINNIRSSAQHNGASEMTLDEINEEIAQSRKERRERPARGVLDD
jgi:PHD/YefM family antitoxin component YafN of YafNO toxin-antitoxin module